MAPSKITEISVGDEIKISWKVDNNGNESFEWYEAIVKKIHRMEGTRYLVCTVEYDDGTVDKSHIFWEKDYGTCWKFAYEDETDDGEDDDSSVDSVIEDNFIGNDDANNWNWKPNWEDEEVEGHKTKENNQKIVYIEPRNNLVHDVENLANELRSIRSSLRAISFMYFITHLPLWVFVYMKVYESFVGII